MLVLVDRKFLHFLEQRLVDIVDAFLLFADIIFFLKLTFSKNSFRNTIRMSNGLSLPKQFAKVISR